MNSHGDGKSPKGYEWVLAALNAIGSALISKGQLPLKPLAGFETPSLIIAFVIGLLGACFGFYRFRGDRIVVFIQAAGLVLAMVFYHHFLDLAGLTMTEKITAVLLYAYLFFSGFYLIAFCERGLKHLKDFLTPTA